MASCRVTVPDLNTSGDDAYGPAICNQPFIHWAWNAFDFDKGDWDNGFGWEAACDITKPLARTFNAIWCLQYSAPDYRDESYDHSILQWGCRYARTHIDELDARCGEGTKVATTRHFPTPGVDEWTELYLPFFYQRAVPERAGTLVHESRHASGKSHDDGKRDSSWAHNGGWRWHVCWLAWFAQDAEPTRTTAAMRAIARQRANDILASSFTTPPGFTV